MYRLRTCSALAAMVLLGSVVLAGCDSNRTSSSTSAAGSTQADSAALPADAARAGSAAQAGAAAKAAAPAATPATPLQQRDIVRTATLGVRVADVDRAATSIEAAVTAAGGRTDGDDRTGDGAGRTAELVLRVPPDRLDALIASTARLGHETDRSVKGEDVTASRADVTARVQALATSVARLRQFLSHSGSITDLVALEGQLSTRESDLESTQAQQRALADQITLASLTVELTSPAAPAAAKATSGPSGFGTAVAGGWHALVVVLRVIGAGLGYSAAFVIPVALIAALALAIRRRRTASGPVRNAEGGS